MGKNKLYKFAKLETYPHVFQADFNEKDPCDYHLKGNWNNAFFKNDNPIILEIGCGKGEYTVGLAQLYPNKNFIGIDIKGARIYTGATQSLELGLDNVAFLRCKVELLSYFFANNEIDEIWITFPDPQMRKTRKRLTSTRFLDLYRSVLVENGLIHLKTDSAFMFSYTTEMLKHNNIDMVKCTSNLYSDESKDIISEDDVAVQIKTFYEGQFYEQGIPIKYVQFTVDKDLQLDEPDLDIEHDDYRSYNRGSKMPENKI